MTNSESEIYYNRKTYGCDFVVQKNIIDDTTPIGTCPISGKTIYLQKIVTIDAKTGKEVHPIEPIDITHTDNFEYLKAEIQSALKHSDINLPGKDMAPKYVPEKSVLSEFVGAKEVYPSAEKSIDAPMVGHGDHVIDGVIDAFDITVDISSAANVMPHGSLNDYHKSFSITNSSLTQTIDNIIPGSTYASIALEQIQLMRSNGTNTCSMHLEIPSSSVFAEFKSIMASHGIVVNTGEIVFTHRGRGYDVTMSF
ncbi:MAG: hypothetical protein WC284_07835 [Candidimonas sp.]